MEETQSHAVPALEDQHPSIATLTTANKARRFSPRATFSNKFYDKTFDRVFDAH